ncbi:MAG: tetratricopeptide repeat protein, partial [bacterium]
MERGTQRVGLDELHDDPRTTEEVRRTEGWAPFKLLEKREGVLMRVEGADTDEVAFAMDRYLEQAAGAVLVADGKAESPADLAAALEELGEHPLAEEIVEVALSLRVATQGREYLWAFIDAVPEEKAWAAGFVAGELVGRLVEETGDAEGIAAELIADPSEGDLAAASVAGWYLDGENLFALQYTFLGAVLDGIGDALPASESLADLIGWAAIAASTINEWERCAEWNERALGMRTELFGEEHAAVAASYSNLGALFSALGETDKAREYMEKALATQLKLFGEEHANVALSYNNLGGLFWGLGDYDKAREYHEKSLAIKLKLFGEEHAHVAGSYNNLGMLFCDLGET